MSAAKKAKTETEEFEALRKYVVACPDVPKDSRAVQAALKGLDSELKRMERDAKLKRKFSAETTTKNDRETKMENGKRDSAAESKSSAGPPVTSSKEDELMDWQDVAAHKEPESLLGARLAQIAISTMAEHGTTVKSPLAAIALALHASLCSDILGFACTGIPETKAPKGFAPPIRELPKNQFVPSKWEESGDGVVCFRYRKARVGSVVLRVQKCNDGQVQAFMTPSNTNEPPSESLKFAPEDHVNLDSFQKALNKTGSVLPSLHYKSLPALLTNFINSSDLGSIREEESLQKPEHLPYMDTTVIPEQVPGADPLRIPTSRESTGRRGPKIIHDPHETPTIEVFHPRPSRGDFAGDLNPPGYGDYMGSRGNLVGPNHPMFGRDGMNPTGGLGMRPRFDPYGPPGGPQDPDNNFQPPRRRPPPGGFGEPNHDHARPPNTLNNNMFM